jgi:hypothetical protein
VPFKIDKKAFYAYFYLCGLEQQKKLGNHTPSCGEIMSVLRLEKELG